MDPLRNKALQSYFLAALAMGGGAMTTTSCVEQDIPCELGEVEKYGEMTDIEEALDYSCSKIIKNHGYSINLFNDIMDCINVDKEGQGYEDYQKVIKLFECNDSIYKYLANILSSVPKQDASNSTPNINLWSSPFAGKCEEYNNILLSDKTDSEKIIELVNK